MDIYYTYSNREFFNIRDNIACISIETYGIAGVKAPLYHKYESQSCAQKAYIEINHKTRLVSANYYHLICDNLPETVLDGTNVRIRVPNDVEGDALVEFMNANSYYFEAICDRIYEVFENSEYIVMYEDGMHTAICSLEQKALNIKRANICEELEYVSRYSLFMTGLKNMFTKIYAKLHKLVKN